MRSGPPDEAARGRLGPVPFKACLRSSTASFSSREMEMALSDPDRWDRPATQGGARNQGGSIGRTRARDRTLRACVLPRRQTCVPDPGSEGPSVVLTPARARVRRGRGTGPQGRNADGARRDLACRRRRLRSRRPQTRRPPAVAVRGGWAGRRGRRHDVRLALLRESSSPPGCGAVQVVGVQLPPSTRVPARRVAQQTGPRRGLAIEHRTCQSKRTCP